MTVPNYRGTHFVMGLFIDDVVLCLFFFFQAEDGIRDVAVTGVQTCALPISERETLGRRCGTARPCGGESANLLSRCLDALESASPQTPPAGGAAQGRHRDRDRKSVV